MAIANQEQEAFREWLIPEGRDPEDPNLSLGHLPIGYVDHDYSFGYKKSNMVLLREA